MQAPQALAFPEVLTPPAEGTSLAAALRARVVLGLSGRAWLRMLEMGISRGTHCHCSSALRSAWPLFSL